MGDVTVIETDKDTLSILVDNGLRCRVSRNHEESLEWILAAHINDLTQQLSERDERIDFLEGRLKGHMIFKSSYPSTAADCLEVIAKGLGEEIMKHHPLQHTEHGTACFVEVRVLDALPPQEDS